MDDKQRGRKTKLTPAVQKKITNAIRAGNYYEAACAYAGIAKATFHNWLNRGEAEKERLKKPYARLRKREAPFVEFLDAVKQAEAEAEVGIVALWRKQIPESWQAARDFLARRYSDRWGSKQQISGPGGGKIELTFTGNIDPEDV